ncbi:MAG TPA: transglycosylase SLT domain-containing protein [Pyrinomonadaceae bacterium]|nr:transglycosylase SLT domain-containing protein [Pyrinomonadaceae bacterium]
MYRKLRRRRLLLIVISLTIVIGASFPFLMSASCLTRQQTSAEQNALTNLRNMTRGDVLPAEDAVAAIESQFPRSKAAALARIVRARIKLNAKDYAGAAQLLDAAVIREQSFIADYALFLRADAFEQAGRNAEARATFLQLINDYPDSLRARESALRVAASMGKSGESSAIPLLLKDLVKLDDAQALLTSAKAYEQMSDPSHALAMYRRLYFFAPESELSSEAATSLPRLGSSTSPGSAEEALTRADKLYNARRFTDAYTAFTESFSAFPVTATPANQLRRGIAAYNVRKFGEAVSALTSVPAGTGETRAEAQSYLAQAYARQRQWEQARATVEAMRRAFPDSRFTPRTLVALGQIADDQKNSADSSYFFRTAVSSYPNSLEVAQAQFDLAWETHQAKNFSESSRMLTEHLAQYADRNTDNRGRAGYWAARDSERAGKLAEARALYEAVIARYDANWYGYLAKQRLDAIRNKVQAKSFAADSLIGRAVANLQIITVAEETAGAEVDARIVKADQLSNIGFDEWALKELAKAGENHDDSPKVNLAIARVYRYQEDNVRALNTLKRSYPDYSQMKPEELTREEWDVFYPLAYWDIIVQESKNRNLDPYQVAGLIRQETIFSSRARSVANAYGLMQVIVPTGRLTAKKYGVNREITAESLYEPRLNIQLGTAYLRDQIDKFGRIEYVAAAYNAGPGRAVQWRASLPFEMDEWAEAVPIKETRGYVQGVVRNRLQYMRLYDDKGNFRPEVGTRAVSAPPTAPGASPTQANPNVRKRRVSGGSAEE